MPKTAIPKFIGAEVRRREDPALVTGTGRYVADIPLAGAVTMAFVRSPYAHAKVTSIDKRPALALPGVLAVFSYDDLRPHWKKALPVIDEGDNGSFEERFTTERYALASDRVRHVGDPVAVVVAEDPYLAADAAGAVVVEYEPLEAISTPEAAIAEGAPRVHDGAPGNRGFTWKLEGGDVDAAFSRAAKVVELDARIQRLVPSAMEPRAVAAVCHDGACTVWASTQAPHGLRDELASILGLDAASLRVIAPEVGGGFGAKGNTYGEDVIALTLARMLKRPVRWAATRSEDFFTTSHGRDQRGKLRLASDASGRVLAADLSLVMDTGAYYSRVTPLIPSLTGIMMTGVYDIPNARARATGVFTNKVWSEPYRGAGRPEAAYLIERGIDLLARELGLDPADVRRRNFIPPDRFPYKAATGITYDSGEYLRALEEALKRVEYRHLRREQRRRIQAGEREKLLGIGIACYVEICGFGPWELGAVRVGPSGKTTVLTGTSPHGQGHETSWAQIAADALQIPMEDIEVLHGDTAVVPRGIGTFGSRSAAVGGSAVLESSNRVKDGAREIAAHLLEAASADVLLERGEFHVVGVPDRSVSWKEVAEMGNSEALPEGLEGKLSAESDYQPPGETFPFGTHVAVVEIDPETGTIEIVRYLTVDDCGRVINPLLVAGQIHGGIAQGIGQALFEGAVYDESGNFVTGSLMEYAVPRADVLPRFECHRTETPTPHNPLGVKGVGEAATIGSTPAVVNAVVDALAHLGVRHIDTPITPEKVWKLLAARSS
jgi:aerobic carbon-monoxide dehydrogenase large subunit